MGATVGDMGLIADATYDRGAYLRMEAEKQARREEWQFGVMLMKLARQNDLEVEELDPLTVAIYEKGWWRR